MILKISYHDTLLNIRGTKEIKVSDQAALAGIAFFTALDSEDTKPGDGIVNEDLILSAKVFGIKLKDSLKIDLELVED